MAPGEIPWQAFLEEHRPAGTFICGGSLIRPTWVFTAAHCISAADSRTEVYLGGTNVNRMSYRQFADLRLPHQDYSTNPTVNDVGLLRLPVAASGPEIALIPMADSSMGSFAGEQVQVSGYGTIHTGGPSSSDLLKADLIALTNEECRRTYRDVMDTNICAQWHMIRNQSPCPGDSGGPLTAVVADGSRVLIGAVSYGRGGPNGCNSGHPVAFARVSSFRSWAENEMANN